MAVEVGEGPISESLTVESVSALSAVGHDVTEIPIPPVASTAEHFPLTDEDTEVGSDAGYSVVVPAGVLHDVPVVCKDTADKVDPGRSRLSDTWERMVSLALSRRPCELKLPWETGVMSNIFNEGRASSSVINMPIWIPTPTVINPLNQTQVTTPSPPPLDAAWWAVRRRLETATWADDLDSKRHFALEKCRAVLQVDPSSSLLGRCILNDVSSLSSDNVIRQSIVDVFANKSTKTIVKRINSFQRFVSWPVLLLVIQRITELLRRYHRY